MMKTEAAVFPFHERMLPFVRHFNQAQNTYHICQALAWSGMGLNGQDASFICRHPNIGVPVVPPTKPDSFMAWQTLLVECDELMKSTPAFDSFAFFDHLLSEGKELIAVTCKNDLSTADGWGALCCKYPEQIHVFSPKYNNLISERERYRVFSLPVLMVGGLITQEDCLEVILALREALMRQGAIVSCLTGSNMGLLMGMHSYTHIFDKKASLSEENKVMALNRLAHEIVQAERPSLLIVEAPDPMLKYNNAAPNGFGLQTYLTCQALKPDLLVCSVSPDMVTEDSFLSMISKDFENRFGMPITAIHVCNAVVDSLDVVQFHRITRVHTNVNRTDWHQKKQGKDRLFPIFDVVSEGADELAKAIFRREELLC